MLKKQNGVVVLVKDKYPVVIGGSLAYPPSVRVSHGSSQGDKTARGMILLQNELLFGNTKLSTFKTHR